jgi:hypothetical protein
MLGQAHPTYAGKKKSMLTKVFDNSTSSTLDSQNSGNLEDNV